MSPLGSAGDHYFSEAPSAASRPDRIRVELADDAFELTTDRSTFSPRRLDPGTAFLLGSAPPPPATGRFLDLGCGYGPIAIALARRSPAAAVVAIDINERSRGLCATNAVELGVGNLTVAAPDDVDGGPFDLIWSNPPIHIGKPALHALLLRWFARLSPEGVAVLVVGRHLGADSLQRWLGEQGFPTDRLASKRGYRLLRSHRAD